MSLHENNKLLLIHGKRCLVSHWPPAFEIGKLLITKFVELRMVVRRTRTPAGRPLAVSRRPILIHTSHAAPLPCCAVALRSRFQNGMVGARHGHGMVFVNQTRSHCVNQMGKTQYKPLAARHGRERYGCGMGTACSV